MKSLPPHIKKEILQLIRDHVDIEVEYDLTCSVGDVWLTVADYEALEKDED